jgi:hypothetical protein
MAVESDLVSVEMEVDFFSKVSWIEITESW